MYGRKVKLRFFFIILVLVTLILSVFLILKSLEENVVYFKSPSDIKTLSDQIKNQKPAAVYIESEESKKKF